VIGKGEEGVDTYGIKMGSGGGREGRKLRSDCEGVNVEHLHDSLVPIVGKI
jgi:hypothetical protein